MATAKNPSPSSSSTAKASPSTSTSSSTSTNHHDVYIPDPTHAWIPARLLELTDTGRATVSVACFPPGHDMLSEANISQRRLVTLQLGSTGSIKSSSMGGATAKASTTVSTSLTALPLQNCHRAATSTTTSRHYHHQQPDLVDLDFLHEAAILYNLKRRLVSHHLPYTKTGQLMMLAVNPYQWIPSLYSVETQKLYAQRIVWETSQKSSGEDNEEVPKSAAPLPPHVYETACYAVRGLAAGENQSILVSGESGAGKTETVKILLSNIASCVLPEPAATTGTTTSTRSSTPPPAPTDDDLVVVQRILDSNPLLEAFGNAQTVRNDNSSRFGKYIQLQFASSTTHRPSDFATSTTSSLSIPALVGSTCQVYLLEQSRVVRHALDEQTYHIFYQLLASPRKTDFWSGLQGTTCESFRYVGAPSASFTNSTDDTVATLEDTLQSLALVHIVEDKLQTLMEAICIVLVLGNIVFVEDTTKNEPACVVQPPPADRTTNDDDPILAPVSALATLLGVPLEHLTQALTIRTVTARQESFAVPLAPPAAKDACDAFAKALYATTFAWLVRHINAATATATTGQQYGTIGLLDIFGFECFETNRFEQLCINYANEKLQHKFTHDIFRSVQAEYEAEGIGALGEITYQDNTEVLELVEGRMGLIAVLNEECVRPGGSDTGFVSKSATLHAGGCFRKDPGSDASVFGIQHYAGWVEYDATQFVTKNMNTLPMDLLECAKASSRNAIVAHELAPGRRGGVQATGGKKVVSETVGSKFRQQLHALMTDLSATRTRYIRCIKPNQDKRPFYMEHTSTVEQLRCAGVVAAVTISRSAFPNRMDHGVVLDRFRSVWKSHIMEIGDEFALDVKQLVDRLLEEALQSLATKKDGNVSKAYVMGTTRTYFREGSLEYLEKRRVQALSHRVMQIQSVIRSFLARRRFRRILVCVVQAQAVARCHLCRVAYLRQKVAAVRIQCLRRCVVAIRLVVWLRRHAASRKIQSCWRRRVCLLAFCEKKMAAIAIAKMVRGALQRPKFRQALQEKREEAKLENQVRALQRKLEEAEQKRVEAERKAEVAASVAETAPVEEKKEIDATSETSSLTQPEPATPAVSTVHQQTLMDESGKMLEYLRKEVFKLRSHNARMRRDFDLLKENNQRLMDANASAGASFAALNQHAKQLAKSNETYKGEIQNYKGHIQKLGLTQVELKEELKMKQATYIAEVHSRLQYQKALTRITDLAQKRCRDGRLVEDILRIADDCHTTDLLAAVGGNDSFSTPQPAATPRSAGDSGLMKSIRTLWSS